MYLMSRRLWIAGYASAWMILGTVVITDQPMWLHILVPVLILGFVGLTSPEPRRTATVRAGCDCKRCASMRARHARRSSDAKDAG